MQSSNSLIGKHYGYNLLNQLVNVSDNGTLLGTYSFGPNSFRVKKVANGKTLYFLYLPTGQLSGEYEPISGGFHVDREHIYLRGVPVGVLSDGGRSNVTASQAVAPIDLNYVHTDVLGTPRKITQADTGFLQWSWLPNDPFGQGTISNTDGIVYNLRYAGQYFDLETGLHENRNRFYDPKTGRYLNTDPIGLAGGMHRYNYVSGDPINGIDPLGLKYAEQWGALGTVTGGTLALGGSVFGDALTGGLNIAATPMEVAAGSVLGGSIGYGLGSFADWILPGNASNNGGPIAFPDPFNMAKGGNQNKDNEYSRAAKMQPDPCEWLKQQYNQASNNIEKMKIKTAQKVLGCRQNSSMNDKCEVKK